MAERENAPISFKTLDLQGECFEKRMQTDQLSEAERGLLTAPISHVSARSAYVFGNHEDGVIEFQGRKDTQVKVRGYRIELGEIEACMGGLEGVREGVVLALGEGSDQKRLVGFVVMREDVAGEAFTPVADLPAWVSASDGERRVSVPAPPTR